MPLHSNFCTTRQSFPKSLSCKQNIFVDYVTRIIGSDLYQNELMLMDLKCPSSLMPTVFPSWLYQSHRNRTTDRWCCRFELYCSSITLWEYHKTQLSHLYVSPWPWHHYSVFLGVSPGQLCYSGLHWHCMLHTSWLGDQGHKRVSVFYHRVLRGVFRGEWL